MGRNAGRAVQCKSYSANSFANSANSNSDTANSNSDTANVQPEYNQSEHDEPKHTNAIDDFSVADAQHHDKPERDNDHDSQRDKPGQHDNHEPEHEQFDRYDDHLAEQHDESERHDSHWSAVHANNARDDDFELYFVDDIAFVWNEHDAPTPHYFPEYNDFTEHHDSATAAVAFRT